MQKQEEKEILSVDDLTVEFISSNQTVTAVNKISFQLQRGEKLGIVGESGSGKSVSCLSILNLLKGNKSNRTTGEIHFDTDRQSVELLNLPESRLQDIRGKRISIVFQEPMSSLNPVRKCGPQVKEVLDTHNYGVKDERKAYVMELFEQVALPDVNRIYQSYPHELSGGQLQRINIAMAIATRPDILICDEPTTALDVTVQKEIIRLLDEIVQKFRISLIFISHDLDVVASFCNRVLVMFQGLIVEEGSLPDVFKKPRHDYTRALLACKPTSESKGFKLPTVDSVLDKSYQKISREVYEGAEMQQILEVHELKVHFENRDRRSIFSRKSVVKAVDGVSFQLMNGEILGIVGESGSGKSTVAYCIAGLLEQGHGHISFRKQRITPSILSADKTLRTKIQLIFQDPYSSLNPRMSVGQAIREPIRYHKMAPPGKVEPLINQLLEQVGLSSDYKTRFPHQLSGGQRQRVCIARALALQPEILICDECVSALDVSVQAQILNLLDKLRNNLGLSLIFISHDLSVVHYLCDRVIVMKSGQIVEQGRVDKIMDHPQHAYTQKLIDSIPKSISA